MTIERIINDLPTDDRACLRLMLELQFESATALARDAFRDLDPTRPNSIDSDRPVTQFDYSGDHDDFNIAAARLLAATTAALVAHTHDSARDALIELIKSEGFIDDATIADVFCPLLNMINQYFND